MFFFFFSSRRRHTRYWRDWSSDVCSSDLTPTGAVLRRLSPASREEIMMRKRSLWLTLLVAVSLAVTGSALAEHAPGGTRSEERRVGKECRSRWSAYP